MAKMVSNAVGFNDDVTGRTPSFYDAPTSNPFFTWIERLVMHATVSPFPQGVPHMPCDTTTQPCFYPYDNTARADAAQNIRSARDSNYYAQVFGWKWGLGDYQAVEAYMTTPDPKTQNGQWHAGPVGAGDRYNIAYIESGPEKKCDPFCNIHPYGSWGTGGHYDQRWDDTINLGAGLTYLYKSIEFGGTGGQWQSQFCGGTCIGMITSEGVGTTVPTVIVGGESSHISLSFGSITVTNARTQRFGGALNYWCHDPTLPPLRTRNGTISSCSNYGWTVTH
jgi:hypothetical protein